MQLNSHVTVCLARVKKRHKCKFVPRLLPMIVGVSWVSFYILYTFCSVEDEREKKTRDTHSDGPERSTEKKRNEPKATN